MFYFLIKVYEMVNKPYSIIPAYNHWVVTLYTIKKSFFFFKK